MNWFQEIAKAAELIVRDTGFAHVDFMSECIVYYTCPAIYSIGVVSPSGKKVVLSYTPGPGIKIMEANDG